MASGEMSWPVLNAGRAEVLFGGSEKWSGYAAWRRDRRSI